MLLFWIIKCSHFALVSPFCFLLSPWKGEILRSALIGHLDAPLSQSPDFDPILRSFHACTCFSTCFFACRNGGKMFPWLRVPTNVNRAIHWPVVYLAVQLFGLNPNDNSPYLVRANICKLMPEALYRKELFNFFKSNSPLLPLPAFESLGVCP